MCLGRFTWISVRTARASEAGGPVRSTFTGRSRRTFTRRCILPHFSCGCARFVEAALVRRCAQILRYLQTGVPDPETAGFPEYRARALFHIREYHDRFIFGRVAASRFFLLQVLRNSRGGSDALRRLARC